MSNTGVFKKYSMKVDIPGYRATINLPENCPCISIFFDNDTAWQDVRENGSRPLWGFTDEVLDETGLPFPIRITCGGKNAPDRRAPDILELLQAPNHNIDSCKVECDDHREDASQAQHSGL